MTRKKIIIILLFVIGSFSTILIIDLVNRYQIDKDVSGYIETDFLKDNYDNYYMSINESFYVYVGYFDNKDIRVIKTYYYDKKLSICGDNLNNHDGFVDYDEFSASTCVCKDYVFFGNKGIRQIVVRKEKDLDLTYDFENPGIFMTELDLFQDYDYLIFYTYGNLEENLSVSIGLVKLYFIG